MRRKTPNLPQMSNLVLWMLFGLVVGELKLPCISNKFKCGHPAVQPDSQRVVGGREAPRGSWPWIVLVAEDKRAVCGGAILSDRFVLTAAHCFSDRSNVTSRWSVIAGKTRLDRYEHSQQSIGVSKLILHEHFNKTTLENDIALILLSTPLPFSTLIQPICVPNDVHSGVYMGQMCMMAGWGDTRGTGDQMALNQVDVPVIADEVCSLPTWYGTEFMGEKTFCAGYESGGKDACTGDSGGPLICKEGTKWVVQGIASWGIDCAAYRWPGIYTEVSKFLTWIQDTVDRESIGLCDILG